MVRGSRSLLPVLAAALAAAGWAGPAAEAAAQDTGTLAGTVVDQLTLDRLQGVRLSIVGTPVSATTDEYGQFLLENVPAGLVSLRIALDGYVSAVEPIEVSEADFLQVRLSPVAAALDELLVVAGRGRPGGVTDRSGDASTDAFRSALDILADDVPGVVVRRGGGNVGTGAAIVVRGAGSFRDNGPDIYLDGVRIDDSPGGSRALNVLDLIPAETVARIRVYKGPSAAAPFALAANGVILVETIRGSGSAR